MPLASIDPSLAIGLYCSDQRDLDDLCARLRDLAKRAGNAPLLTVDGDRAGGGSGGGGGGGGGRRVGDVEEGEGEEQDGVVIGSEVGGGEGLDGRSRGEGGQADDWEML